MNPSFLKLGIVVAFARMSRHGLWPIVCGFEFHFQNATSGLTISLCVSLRPYAHCFAFRHGLWSGVVSRPWADCFMVTPRPLADQIWPQVMMLRTRRASAGVWKRMQWPAKAQPSCSSLSMLGGPYCKRVYVGVIMYIYKRIYIHIKNGIKHYIYIYTIIHMY